MKQSLKLILILTLLLTIVACSGNETRLGNVVIKQEATAEIEPTSKPPTNTPTDSPESEPTDAIEPTAEATATTRPTRTARPTALPAATPTPRPSRPATDTPAASTTQPSPTATLEPTAALTGDEIATVTDIIDGDTIDVNLNGEIFRVRYIGIDTPERGAPCSDEAAAMNAFLVSGETVRMVKDVSETDRFGRLLRYVYVGETFINGALVQSGHADAVRYPPDTSQAALLESLEAQAPTPACAVVATVPPPLPTAVPTNPPQPQPTSPPPLPQPTTPPLPQPTAPPVPQPTQPPPAPTQPPAQNCDPAYPTVCIPSPPPDLDCGDIPFRRFQVLPPDPHRFDGDNDGVGCESG